MEIQPQNRVTFSYQKDGTVGKVHVVKNEGKFAEQRHQSQYCVLRPNPEKLHPSDYLGHFFKISNTSSMK